MATESSEALATPEHLRPISLGDRGFHWMPALAGDGTDCVQIHESSAADAPHIWLSASDQLGEQCVHLPTETARLLAEQLVHLADHVEQVRSTDG